MENVSGPSAKKVTQRNGAKAGAKRSPSNPVMFATMETPTSGPLQPFLTAKAGTLSDIGNPIIVKSPNASAAASADIPESSIKAGGKTANQEYAITPDTAKIDMMDTAVGDRKSDTGAVTIGKVAVITAS